MRRLLVFTYGLFLQVSLAETHSDQGGIVETLGEVKEGKAYFWREAEAGVRPENVALKIAQDGAAFGDQYIFEPDGSASWRFEIPKTSVYRLYGRFLAQGYNDDAFFIRISDSSGKELLRETWNNINAQSQNEWEWDILKVGIESTDEVFEIELSAGEYVFEILPRDADRIKIDRFIWFDDPDFSPGNAKNRKRNYVEFEAESGEIRSPYSVSNGENASGGKYVSMIPADATYTFQVDQPGQYRIWGYLYGEDHHSDSMFVMLNDIPINSWSFALDKRWGEWKWTPYSREGSDTFFFEKGPQVLRLAQRETGSRLDAILITDDLEFTPRDSRE